MRPALLTRPLLLATSTALALALTGAPASAAGCKKHPGSLAASYGNRVWHTGSTLYGCQGENAASFPAIKLGKWGPGTKVSLSSGVVLWTVPGRSGAKRYDRIWAAQIASGSPWGTWLAGVKAIPAGAKTSARDGRVQSLRAVYAAASWITRTGDVALAVQQPTKPPAALGDLPGTLTAHGKQLLVGSWPDVPAADLAQTARLNYKGAARACEDSGDLYALTVQLLGETARAGAKWWDSSQFVDCP